MRSKGWISVSRIVFALLICPLLVSLAAVPSAMGQTEEGAEDLEKAFQAKIDASTGKDLDGVVKLCESAIKKGLDESGLEQANQLAASALYQLADQLGQKIFSSGARDPRWRIYRSQALSRLAKATKFKPDMGEAYLMIAKLNSLPGGDKGEARKAVEKAVELAGDDRQQLSSALFYRASLAENDEAQLADLNQAIKINPENMDAVRVRAAYYFRKQEPENALEDLNQWLKSDEKNVGNYINVAQQLMLTGPKFDESLQKEAIRILDKAIEIDPDNSLPHTLRANINLIGDKLDDAINDANRAVKLDRKNFEALLLRATIFSEQQKLDEALEDVNKALEIQPLLVSGIRMRGIIRMQQEKFSDAIEDFRLLANNDRANLAYQRQLALLYNANDQPSRAIRIYDRLLDEDADGSWDGKSAGKQLGIMRRRAASLRGKGDALLSSGKHPEAVKSFEEALKLGKSIAELEESEGAEEPSTLDDGVLNNLAWVLATSPDEEVRDGQRAIELATQAAELTEFKQAHILSTLASGYAETGDFENAIKWIEKAIKVNSDGEEGMDEKRTETQRQSLQKEYESYKKKEPWRELQDVEQEKKDKAKAEQDEESGGDDDEDDDDEDEEDDDDDEDEDDGDEKVDDDQDKK